VNIIEQIKKLSAGNLKKVTEVRRHLHANPELSFNEVHTAKYVEAALKDLGLSSKRMANTGIVCLIDGKKPGKTIALRADMDALPIEEKNDVPYKSKNEGIMHACGHDVHTSSLLGTAMILKALKNEWEGTVKLIFQPGEERLPGGASIMIKEGVLDHPAPQSIYAQHVFPSLETGKVGFCAGTYMASCDEIYLTIKGKGGHAAMPASYISPILIASQVLLELENKFMKKPENSIPTVLAFGKMQANGATNVIPQEVYLEGTFRTMNEEWRAKAHKMIEEIIKEKCKSMGGDHKLRIEVGYPVLTNNEELTQHARSVAEEYLGKSNVITLDKRMTSEDFSYYSLHKPVCFYRLGTANEARGITSGVHTPTFDIEEKALETGMGLMAWIAINELKRNN
jgi:amidohydrolase